jgi:phosphinothricin acetyltransferase
MADIIIRHAEVRDVPAITAIYNRYIADTATTFDIVPYTLERRREWFEQFAAFGRHQCFVADRDGVAIGWACTGRWRPKAAYDCSVETSVYLAPGDTGRGLGSRLYRVLLDALAREDVHRAYALVTLPNEASVALHLAQGFRHIGTMGEVGRKFGRFWDVGWFERAVSPGLDPSTGANPLL